MTSLSASVSISLQTEVGNATSIETLVWLLQFSQALSSCLLILSHPKRHDIYDALNVCRIKDGK
jgi:hypothetical protein